MSALCARIRSISVHVERVFHDLRDLDGCLHPNLYADVVVVGELSEHPADGFRSRRGLSLLLLAMAFFAIRLSTNGKWPEPVASYSPLFASVIHLGGAVVAM